MSAPDKYWRVAYGDVVSAWNPEKKAFGHRARIRTGRTTKRVLWEGTWRPQAVMALNDLKGHQRRRDFSIGYYP